MTDKESWYSMKDLFEQINALKDDVQELRGEFKELRTEMKVTRDTIKKYNGLRQEMYEIQLQIKSMQEEKSTKAAVSRAIREWGGWIIAILSLVGTYIKIFMS